ncbi:hypothetical protein MalM25_19780 [Planctomycetes bacterium MalM25]|nr:hypothetical protein MalM25_19780 [Planctomycetes bacterium MalM25]
MSSSRGYTLIELMVAIASASVLMIGLSGALFVSARALETDEGATLKRSRADQALSRVLSELSEATRIESASATELRFRVPDRDADGVEESLAFTWSGVAGDPLRFESQGRNAVLLRDVTSLDFTSLTRFVAAQDVTIPPPPPWPLIEAYSSVKVESKETELTLPAPLGVQAGELLIASLAIHHDRSDSIASPPGWAVIDLGHEDDKVMLGVWWKLATNAEPDDYTWSWSGSTQAIGVALRISNQYAGNPLTAFSAFNGKSSAPVCSAAGVTLDNSLVLRIGGFHKDKVGTPGETGLADHTDVFMDTANGDVSLGVGHQVQEESGGTSQASFALTGDEVFRTLTIVVAPAGGG